MHRFLIARVFLVVISGMLGFSACGFKQDTNRISLLASDDGQRLRVEYQSARPTKALVFARTPNGTRPKRWQFSSPGFEFAEVNGKDVIYRTDRSEFSSVEVVVPTTYSPLPKDYAPFSPFTDGGLLIHSGRFQACPSNLGTVKDCDGPWSMRIQAPPTAHILLHGERYEDQAGWSDSGDGTKIYVGWGKLESDTGFVGIVDPALPPDLSGLMSTALPELMDYYGRRLPRLAQQPMLFVSYDPSYEHGYGNQGGVLPNQVFMHFYGATWEEINPESNVPEEIAWFFAHEAGHIFQQGVAGERESAWIHEGAAEAFAYLALKELEIVSTSYLNSRRIQAKDACGDALEIGALTTAAERGNFADFYNCGLTMFIAVDAKIRARSGNQLDLFDLWSAIIPELKALGPLDSADFLKKVEPWIGGDLAGQLLSLATEMQVETDRTLTELGN